MQITRRNFLQTISAAVACAVVGSGPQNFFGQKQDSSNLFPLPGEVYSEPLFSMTSKQLNGFIGHDFTATAPDGVVIDLILTEVNPLEHLSNSTEGLYGECFSLIFENRKKRVLLRQDTYDVRAAGLAPFSALIVPTDRMMRRYEIVVNHLSY